MKKRGKRTLLVTLLVLTLRPWRPLREISSKGGKGFHAEPAENIKEDKEKRSYQVSFSNWMEGDITIDDSHFCTIKCQQAVKNVNFF